MLHKYCRLLFFSRKIGDFKVTGLVCLLKKFVYLLSYNLFFGDFFNHVIENKLDGSVHIT